MWLQQKTIQNYFKNDTICAMAFILSFESIKSLLIFKFLACLFQCWLIGLFLWLITMVPKKNQLCYVTRVLYKVEKTQIIAFITFDFSLIFFFNVLEIIRIGGFFILTFLPPKSMVINKIKYPSTFFTMVCSCQQIY